MQIDKEEIKKLVAQATQNAWRRDTLTTVNSIVEFIVNESIQALADQINENFARLEKDIDELFAASATLYDKLKELPNGEDGRTQKSKRNAKPHEGESRITAG